MSSTNPYNPPQAAVAQLHDVDGSGFQQMKIWSWRGRLGRMRFLAYGTVAYLLFAVLMGVATAMAIGSRANPDVASAMVWLLMIPYGIFLALVTIRRSHDMGWSGWMSLLALIPLVGLIWLFKAGNPGANEYGAPPPPNTGGVKFAAFGLAAVVMIGILAAVSLPAYQQYVKRAQAAAQHVPAR